MYRAFQHFDTDNSGTISQAELREALRVSPHCLRTPAGQCLVPRKHLSVLLRFLLCPWSTHFSLSHLDAGCSSCPGCNMLQHQVRADSGWQISSPISA